MSHSLGFTGAPSAAPSPQSPAPMAPTPWIGTNLGWAPGVEQGKLIVSLAPNEEALTANRTEALEQYRKLAAQLAEPGVVQVAVTCSINSVSGPVPIAAAEVGVIAYVNAVAAHLDADEPLPSPVKIAVEITAPAKALPPVAIHLTLVVAHFDATDATNRFPLPNAWRVDADVPADFAMGFAAFADRFHQAFSSLRLAIEGRRADTAELWVCGRGLTKPTVTDAPTYFAAAPLVDSLQSGEVTMPEFGDFSKDRDWPPRRHTFSSVDGDQLLLDCFREIDGVLAEPMASAVERASPANFATLVSLRAAVAEAYTGRVFSPLFEEQAGSDPKDPVLAGARTAYRELVGVTLSDAFAVDAMLAFPATWAEPPVDEAAPELSLLGFTRSVDGAPSTAPSSGRLQLHGQGAKTGTLYYAFRPNELTADTSLTAPLEFVATHVGVGDLPDGGTRWLALIAWETIRFGPEKGTVLPIIHRFAPQSPTLLVQTAMPLASAEPKLSELLEWEYRFDLTVHPVPQDVTTIALHPNTVAVAKVATRTEAPGDMLVAALLRFHAGFAQIEPVLPDLRAGKPTAAAITAAIVDLFTPVKNAAAGNIAGRREQRLTPEPSGTAKLTVALAPDKTAPGRWTMTVVTVDALAAGTLSVTPCTLRGEPQPNVQTVGHDPLVLSYEPVDRNAEVLVRVTAKQLPLLGAQTMQAAVRLSRNDRLLPSLTTLPSFLRSIPPSTFSGPIVPRQVAFDASYDLADFADAPASGSLADWLALLFQTVFAGTAPVEVNLKANYAMKLASGSESAVGLTNTLPILLTGPVPIDGGGADSAVARDLVDAIAAGIANWIRALQPSENKARFEFELTVYGAERIARPVLLETSFRLSRDKVTGL